MAALSPDGSQAAEPKRLGGLRALRLPEPGFEQRLRWDGEHACWRAAGLPPSEPIPFDPDSGGYEESARRLGALLAVRHTITFRTAAALPLRERLCQRAVEGTALLFASGEGVWYVAGYSPALRDERPLRLRRIVLERSGSPLAAPAECWTLEALDREPAYPVCVETDEPTL